MKVSDIFLVLYLAHGHHVSAVFIGGRASCGATRTVTAASVVSSNCYRLANANAILACSRYSNKPVLVNYGTSLFITACNDPNPINTGPKFAIFNPNYYYVDIQLVSSDTNAALLGLVSYLSYDANTGYLNEGLTPAYDVTQVYSVVLINRLTGATSDPVYFTAKLGGCNVVLAGPSSVTVCTGPVPPINPLVPLSPVALYTVCSPGVVNVVYDGGLPPIFCPTVTGATNTDATPCYISTSSGNTMANYVLGPNLPPLIKFTQFITITANPIGAGNLVAGTRNIAVTFDPTCIFPAVTTTC